MKKLSPVYNALAAAARSSYGHEWRDIVKNADDFADAVQLRNGAKLKFGPASALEAIHALGRFINALPEPEREALRRYMENQRLDKATAAGG